MKKNKIGLAGNGWGAIAALKSLQNYFRIECLTKDKDVISKLSKKDSLIDSFEDFKSEFIICAGYKQLVSKLTLEKHTILNVHYSLLPKYRGLHSLAWAIMDGEKLLGWTVHLMNQNLDDGPIIYQRSLVNDMISSATFYMNQINNQVKTDLGNVTKSFINGEIIPKEQDKSKSSWVGKRGNNHNFINFSNGHELCHRLFRVLQHPYPYPKVRYMGKVYIVSSIKFHESTNSGDVSRILNIDDDGVWVKSKDGYVILTGFKDEEGEDASNYEFKIGAFFND